MRDRELLIELLAADTEEAVLAALNKRGLMGKRERWRYLGNMPNNQSIVHAQQSTAAAALVEKYTNGVDALLLRNCKAKKIDPRGKEAPQSMSRAVELLLGPKAEQFANASRNKNDRQVLREFAEQNLVLYATGTKARPSLSFYDAGEGQLPNDFPTTFCSLIHGSGGGSYKGAIPFVQGRFNMGSSGVLPFCSDKHKMQLIVSRVPQDVAGGNDHEWGYTIVCFFPSKQDPSWHYLVGEDGSVVTAGSAKLGLVPKLDAKSGELCAPLERKVDSGTLVKMYDFQAPRSNVCGELFKKLEEFLLRPPLPLRIIECREGYSANVMGVTVWDRLGVWAKDKLEKGFEDGAGISLLLETGETVPADIRVFKLPDGKPTTDDEDSDQPQTGVRAVINGQSHAKRDAQFFRTKLVDKEHIAGSMLVILDCTDLGQDSRNAIFMSNRETFRDDPLLNDLFGKLKRELRGHEGLIELNKRRYEEKIKNAVDDEDGINALEELLRSDPDLADLFGTKTAGTVAAKTALDGSGVKVEGTPKPFFGQEFPTYFHRADKSTRVEITVPRDEVGRASFLTDVRNDYFSRRKNRGTHSAVGDLSPSLRIFNGRLTLTFALDKTAAEGSRLTSQVTITDNKGSGPFKLDVAVLVGPAIEKKPPGPTRPPTPPKVAAGPSRPDIKEVHNGPDAPPLTIEPVPDTDRLKLLLNVDSNLLVQARSLRPPEEVAAVDFVFKYGLALTALGLLDSAKKTPQWQEDQAACRQQIVQTIIGVARVIVPLCLSLPKKLPKAK
jgi:hypothetical protein